MVCCSSGLVALLVYVWLLGVVLVVGCLVSLLWFCLLPINSVVLDFYLRL